MFGTVFRGAGRAGGREGDGGWKADGEWSGEVGWGGDLQSCSTGVLIFFSEIFSYFCFLFAARSPCHGRLPLLKYMST